MEKMTAVNKTVSDVLDQLYFELTCAFINFIRRNVIKMGFMAYI